MPDEQRDDIDRVEDDDDIGRLNDLFASTFDAATLDQVLHGAGVHPDDIVTLLRYAPLGLTHLCWRNTVLEDWHAGPESRIHDGDMMRGNVATTRLFAQALWAAFADQIADAELMCRADFTDEDIDMLAGAFADALEGAFSAERTLPHGVTLGELGGDQVAELYDHAATQLGALLEQAELHGVAVVLMWLAARGRMSCADWWGSPRWPLIVDALLARLANPADEFWARYGRPQLPAQLADQVRLRHLLLSAPDKLSTETVEFCIERAGLGFIRIDD